MKSKTHFGLRISEELKEALESEAKARGTSKSEMVIELLERVYVKRETDVKRRETFQGNVLQRETGTGVKQNSELISRLEKLEGLLEELNQSQPNKVDQSVHDGIKALESRLIALGDRVNALEKKRSSG
ncbi:MAG: CopG family transcriptional regulator [Microcoleaceae cyanobacterium]